MRLRHWILGLAATAALLGAPTQAEDGTKIDVETKKLCRAISLATNAVDGVVDFAKDQERREAAERKIAGVWADIILSASRSTGVPVAAVDSKELAAVMTTELENLGEARAAANPGAATVEDRWTAVDISREALSVAAIADPTGVVGVVAAYTYPTCASKEAKEGQSEFCYRDSAPRGVGTIPTDCPPGKPDKQAGLCYSPCPANMNGVGPVCWTTKRISQPRGVGVVPVGCPSSHPDKQAGLCYQSCPSGMSGQGPVCWTTERVSYGRGAGVVPDACSGSHPDKQAGLCYRRCRAGFNGKGPVCWNNKRLSYGRGAGTIPQNIFTQDCGGKENQSGLCYTRCRAGYTGRGPVCWLNEQASYGRGVGVVPSGCPASRPHKQAGLCYARCRSGYTGQGPVCWTNRRVSKPRGVGVVPVACPSSHPEKQAGLCYRSCPSYFRGEGPVCWTTERVSQPRGVGVPPNGCGDPSRPEYDAGLCYSRCTNGYYGIGPVCWNRCEGKYPTECASGCARNALSCGLVTADMVASPFEAAASIASLGSYSGANSAKRATTTAAKKAATAIAKEALEEGAERAAREAVEEAAEAVVKKAAKKLAKEADGGFSALLKRARKAGDDEIDDIADAMADALKRRVKAQADEAGETVADLLRRKDEISGNLAKKVFQKVKDAWKKVKDETGLKRIDDLKKRLESREDLIGEYFRIRKHVKSNKAARALKLAQTCATAGVTIYRAAID